MALKKSTLDNYQSSFPDIIKLVGDYLKAIVSKDSLDTLSTSTGTIATLVKVFSKPLVDKVFNEISNQRLKDFGLEIYLKTSLNYANDCLNAFEDDSTKRLTEDFKNDLLRNTLPDVIKNQIDIVKVNPVLIFQPKFHPVVILIKNIFVDLLGKANIDEESINKFLKNFNNGIVEKIILAFGDDYEKHILEVKSATLNEKEAKILTEIVKEARIGFDDQELISYVESYGQWLEVQLIDHPNFESSGNEQSSSKGEADLQEVKTLVNQYFTDEPDKTIEKILFIIADFGKGKSVFLKNFAAELAKQYLLNSEGYFPVYFNLRDYSRFQTDSKNGVIYDYLETIFGVKLDDPYFKSKRYFFLIDSLDESGELVRANIDKIINSIKRIQNIDKEYCRENRILVASRPFDDGLKNQLLLHQPFQKINESGKKQAFYISLYGFKKEQLNEWLSELLKKNTNFINGTKSVYGLNIANHLKSESIFDFHKTLSDNGTLSFEELKRPIFGYMIYQLLLNDYDFLKVGKIGVYLSFINLLSKEAKYIHDKNYSFSLIEQFECRNILHTIASLWSHERVLGKQGSLKKADVCRAVEVDIIDVDDEKVLERYKGKGINEISFLSHSYFGENDNILHFQHQSFAEILLAEYYLKILIKFSLDRSMNINQARKKLFVGLPSVQTLDFLKALLIIFKESCKKGNEPDVIEKRKLLFPFIASIAVEKYNKELSSDTLFFEWFKKFNWTASVSDPPIELLENWFFDDEKLDEIGALCKEIIDDNSYELLISKSSKETAIFNNELTKISYEDLSTRQIDKLLVLFAGNILINDIDRLVFFLGKFSLQSTITILETMLGKTALVYRIFKDECFKGINLKGNGYFSAKYLSLEYVDFSFSHFENISFDSANLNGTDFSHVIFHNVVFSNADISRTRFYKSKFLGVCHFALSIIGQGLFFPYYLANKIFAASEGLSEVEDNNSDFSIEFLGILSCFGDEITGLNSRHLADLKSFQMIMQYFVNESKIITTDDILKGFRLLNTNDSDRENYNRKLLADLYNNIS